jgi:hypothetical protein
LIPVFFERGSFEIPRIIPPLGSVTGMGSMVFGKGQAARAGNRGILGIAGGNGQDENRT